MEVDELKDCSYKPSKITRDKEIEKASKEFAYSVSSIRPELNADSFKQGAKWADKTMIEKACEWLKEELMDNRDNFGYPVVSTFDIITLNEFIEEFKKAMEE